MDKFYLVAKGMKDGDQPGVVRVTPSCYDNLAMLKRKSGLPLTRIIEQCVDFAIDHMDNGAETGV